MLLQEPAFRLLSISLKYGPWRDALLSAYREVSRRRQGVRARGGGGSSRASFILDVLSATCVAMSEVIPEAWIKHLGYNISHCQGPVPTLSKLGVIRPAACSASGRSGVKMLLFGKQRRFKRLFAGAAERRLALRRVGAYTELADDIGDLAAPRTCQEWVDSAAALLPKIQAFGRKGDRRRRRVAQRCLVLRIWHLVFFLGGG